MVVRRAGYSGSATGCYEVVQFAGQIWQRVFFGGETSLRVAADLGINRTSVHRMYLICKTLKRCPSQRRLALCVMRHPDISDEEIADLFGRNLEWVAEVRRNAYAIEQAEKFPQHLEWLDDGVHPDDPTPDEIAAECALLRSRWVDGIEGRRTPEVTA